MKISELYKNLQEAYKDRMTPETEAMLASMKVEIVNEELLPCIAEAVRPFGELFVAALKLILDTGKRFSILGLAGKKIGIAEPIAAHTVVTDFMEPFLGIVLIGNQQSSLPQDAYLVGKRLNLLNVRYSTHHLIIKKAHPKRAVLREAG